MEQLSNAELTIKVNSVGAELSSIRAQGVEYLWQANPEFWKRHSPVLFPFVGSVWNGVYRYEGKEYLMGQHGFARDMDFVLVYRTDEEVRYRLISSAETYKKYPFDFCLEIGYRLHGKKIDVLWDVWNTGSEVMHFQIGAHPAFYYPNYDPAVPQRGFFGFDRLDGLHYILVGEKGGACVEKQYPVQLMENLLPLDVHTFDNDAWIIQDNQVREVVLYTNDRKPWLAMQFDAPVVGLWSPPSKNAPFVCIEPWYGRCDRMNFQGELKDRDWMQHLEIGGHFHSAYTIEIK